MIPIDALVNRITIRRRILVVQHPVEWHDCSVKLTHQELSNIVDAVLIMSLVHLRNVFSKALNFRRYVDVVVLPNVVEAMDGVGAHGGGWISTTDRVWILDGCEVVPDPENVIRTDADLTVWWTDFSI